MMRGEGSRHTAKVICHEVVERQALLRLVADVVPHAQLTSTEAHGLGWHGVTVWEHRVAREAHATPFKCGATLGYKVGGVRLRQKRGRQPVTEATKDRVHRIWWSHAVAMSCGRKYQPLAKIA